MKEIVRRRVVYAVLFSLFLVILLTVFLLLVKSSTETVCESKECIAAAKKLKDSIDMSVKPCDNFYQYACGNWPKTHDDSISSFYSRYEQNEEEILEFLKQKNNADEPEAVHKARQLYSTCLNPKSHNGTELLKQILKQIGLPLLSFSTKQDPKFDYVRAIARTTRMAGIKMFFDISVEVNPHNHSLNAIWLTKPEVNLDPNAMPLIIEDQKVVKNETRRNTTNNFIDKVTQKMCKIASSSSCSAKDPKWQTDILLQERDRQTLMLKARNKFNSSYIPTIYTLEELQNMSDNIAEEVKSSIPKLNWTRYIEEMFDGLKTVNIDLTDTSNVQIVIHEINFIQDMIKFIHERKIEQIELGLWWKVVSTLLPYADFDIFEAINGDSNTREQRCNEIVTSSFGMAISYMYLKKEKYNKAKNEAEEMLKYIKESYKKTFEQASWMDQDTRNKSLKKLESIKSLVAYPNLTELSRTLDEMYGNVTITHNLLGTMVKKIQNQINENLNSLNQINNLTAENWPLPPTIVNAFYSPLDNVMVIPAAILGTPTYMSGLNALNYGSIGFVVGHEFTHGFDNNGRKYNEKGELEDWWNDETLVKYKEKSRCFLNAYDNYNVTFEGIDEKVNSTLTLGEDISDNVGFREALLAYRSYVSDKGKEPTLIDFEIFTPEQLFTLGFANLWCERPTSLSTVLNALFNDHSPAAVRVNGVFKNSQEFSNIWNCSKGTNMNPLDEKCTLW